jgi:hypothetical protein
MVVLAKSRERKKERKKNGDESLGTGGADLVAERQYKSESTALGFSCAEFVIQYQIRSRSTFFTSDISSFPR